MLLFPILVSYYLKVYLTSPACRFLNLGDVLVAAEEAGDGDAEKSRRALTMASETQTVRTYRRVMTCSTGHDSRMDFENVNTKFNRLQGHQKAVQCCSNVCSSTRYVAILS